MRKQLISFAQAL